MKVLVIGVFTEFSTSVPIANGFDNADCETIRYSYRERAGKVGAGKRDEEIIELTKKEKPDLVLFCKCNTVSARVVIECNKISKTCIWYMDPMHNWDSDLELKVRYATFACHGLTVPYEKSLTVNKNSFYLDQGFDPLIDKPYDLAQDIDVSFIGALYGDRQQWHKDIGFTNITGTYGTEHAKTVSRSKINLNFIVKHEGTSTRIYKLMASSGFVMTNDWPLRETAFEDGKDLVIFNSSKDLKNKIDYYLEHEDKRKAIAAQGLKTVQKFSWNHFAKKVLGIHADIGY